MANSFASVTHRYHVPSRFRLAGRTLVSLRRGAKSGRTFRPTSGFILCPSRERSEGARWARQTRRGTWLAVNKHGVVAGLTNRPSPRGRDPTKRSRGELPLLLAKHRSATATVADLMEGIRPSDDNPAWLFAMRVDNHRRVSDKSRTSLPLRSCPIALSPTR